MGPDVPQIDCKTLSVAFVELQLIQYAAHEPVEPLYDLPSLYSSNGAQGVGAEKGLQEEGVLSQIVLEDLGIQATVSQAADERMGQTIFG
jgi:hypothetical protein